MLSLKSDNTNRSDIHWAERQYGIMGHRVTLPMIVFIVIFIIVGLFAIIGSLALAD